MFKIYKKLLRVLDARERRRASLVFSLMLLTALGEMAGVASVMPFLTVLANPDIISENKWLKLTYDTLGFQSRDSFLIAMGATFFITLVCSLSLRALGFWAQLRFSFNRSVSWSQRLIASYLYQPYEWFLNKHSSELTTAVLSEVDSAVNGSLVPAMQIIAHTTVATLLLTLLVVVDPVLALSVGIVMGGGFGLISVTMRKRVKRLGAERLAASRKRFHVVQEAFGGIKDMKLSGLEHLALARFRAPSEIRAQRQISVGIMSQMPGFLMQGLLFGGMMLVLLYLVAAKGGFEQALPIMGLYALAGYRLMPAIQKIFEENMKIRSTEPVLDSLVRDLYLADETTGSREKSRASDALPRISLGDGLSLKDIKFRYPLVETFAVKGVSLEIPAFHTIGLVGSTGSGKTTLVDIMLGLLRPTEGQMSVDGTVINVDNVRRWQRSIGYVPQHIFLTDSTVASNIAFGLPPDKIDLDAVERAARIASLHEFVTTDLPQGYQTMVGERGVRLSGGQRQRIGIARAMYGNPDVLVLDEATSALDNLTEHAVMDAVRALSKRKTIIMIAHRLSTVRDCDCIYLLEKGLVVAQGSYDELIERSEHFRKLAASA